MNIPKLFKRPCKDCEELFRPTGKYTKFCDKCLKKKRLAIKQRWEKYKVNK